MFRSVPGFGIRSRAGLARARRSHTLRTSFEAVEDRTLMATLSALVFGNGAHTVVYGIGYDGLLFGSEDGGPFQWVGTAGKQVSAGFDASDNPDYYVINAQNQVDFVNPTSPVGLQTSLGSVVAGYATAISATMRDTLYYIGPGNEVYELFWPDQFFSFTIPLGFVATQISAGLDASGRAEVFAVGSDDSVYVDDGNGWVDLYFPATAISATVDNTVYALDDGIVFVDRGSGFVGLGGTAALAISAGYDTLGNPDVYAIGASNAVYVNDGGGWIDLGGYATELSATGDDVIYNRGQDPDSIYGEFAAWGSRLVGNLLSNGANPNAATSDNWAGYIAETNLNAPQQNSVTYVSASWVDTASTTWVGIDGKGSSGTVEQVGTSGSQAWWEMYPLPEVPIRNMAVRPGDVMSAYVEYFTGGWFAGYFALSITDDSRPNDSFTTLEPASASGKTPMRDSAEWIVEYPSPGLNDFADATAVINGVAGPISSPSWQSQALDIPGVAYTSVLMNSGDAFLVTVNAIGPNLLTMGPSGQSCGIFRGPDVVGPGALHQPRPRRVATASGAGTPSGGDRPATAIDALGPDDVETPGTPRWSRRLAARRLSSLLP